jgi:CubicO group peptidase (beta-lactamase class C family)
LRRLLQILFMAVLAAGCAAQSVPPTQRDYWPTADWRTADPGALGVDSGRLQALDAHIQAEMPHIYSVVVARRGYVVFERTYQNFYPDFDFEAASITKSVTGMLVGIALNQGTIDSLDQAVIDFFPEYDDGTLDSRTPKITVRHLLTMTSGYDWSEEYGWRWPEGSSWMAFALRMITAHKPGEVFTYNTPAAHLLSGIITRATGMSLADFANQNLFAPLGIAPPEWSTDPEGYTTGAHGLHLRAREVAKLGYLALNRGRWDGAQIVPAAWLAESTRQHSAGGFPEYAPYGYLWWVAPEYGAYFAAGYGGQYLYVVPSLDLVVITSETERPHNENRDLIEQGVIAAVER